MLKLSEFGCVFKKGGGGKFSSNLKLMNIVVLLFLQCGRNHRDCFQSAYCEASFGHSAGYESEALFYHSAKDS